MHFTWDQCWYHRKASFWPLAFQISMWCFLSKEILQTSLRIRWAYLNAGCGHKGSSHPSHYPAITSLSLSIKYQGAFELWQATVELCRLCLTRVEFHSPCVYGRHRFQDQLRKTSTHPNRTKQSYKEQKISQNLSTHQDFFSPRFFSLAMPTY